MNLLVEHETPPGAKLPFWHTVALTYSTYFAYFTDVLRISWLWLVLAAPLTAMANWQQSSWMAQVMADMKLRGPARILPRQPIEMPLLQFSVQLFVLLAGVSIAVAWHRRLILQEAPGFSASNVTSKNLWRYIGIGLAIFLMVIIPTLVILMLVVFLVAGVTSTMGPGPRGIAVVPLFAFVFALFLMITAVLLRLSLLLPARAVGDIALTLKETWKRTQGNTWRLFWGLLICTAPPLIAAQIAMLLLVGFPVPGMLLAEEFAKRMTVYGTIFMLYYLLNVPLGIGFLSNAYRYFFAPQARELHS